MTHAFEDMQYLYFFISKKSESILYTDFQQQAESVLGIHIHGRITRFGALLEEIMCFSKENKTTLIIDEFQRLAEIDEGIISDIQQVWDRHHAESHIHLIACGSIFSMMQRLFEDRKEPLFGRKTARIEFKTFSTYMLKEILHDHNPNYTAEDLLMLYAITGGVAKYVAQLMIDLIAIKRIDREAVVAEAKRNPNKIDLKKLEEKYKHIQRHLNGYRVELIGLSMDDM